MLKIHEGANAEGSESIVESKQLDAFKQLIASLYLLTVKTEVMLASVEKVGLLQKTRLVDAATVHLGLAEKFSDLNEQVRVMEQQIQIQKSALTPLKEKSACVLM